MIGSIIPRCDPSNTPNGKKDNGKFGQEKILGPPKENAKALTLLTTQAGLEQPVGRHENRLYKEEAGYIKLPVQRLKSLLVKNEDREPLFNNKPYPGFAAAKYFPDTSDSGIYAMCSKSDMENGPVYVW